MKVIDLFIEYTKDTVQPEKVKFRSKEYTYTGNSVLYNLIKDYEEDIIFYLNEEVEIIEEDKEIEPLNKLRKLENGNENESMLFFYCYDLERKQQELIKAVNELKKGK